MDPDDSPDKQSAIRGSAQGTSKREDQLKATANNRKFKKDSIIFGIPVKNNSKNLNQSLNLSTATMSQKKTQPGVFDCLIIAPEALFYQIFNDFYLTTLAFASTILAAYWACFGFPGSKDYQEEPDMAWLYIDSVMEISFALDIVIHFFVQYQDQDDRKPVRDLKKIAIRYISRRLPIDFIATFPWRWIFNMPPRYKRLLYICRWVRFTKLATITDLQKFQTLLKDIFRKRLNNIIQTNSNVRESNREDNNKIMLQIYIMYIFRVLRLVVFILFLSYFLGAMWYIATDLFTDEDDEKFTFYNYYSLGDFPPSKRLIIVVYFAFTTLSTVGFGDFNPKHEAERIMTTFILLVGVAVFSYIMGQFIEILMNLQTVTADNEDSENLSKWLGLLAHFNKNRPLPKDMTKRFEVYFEYYWQNDKNYAIQSKEDQRFMEELPNHIKTDIYKDFLFYDFLYLFHIHFQLLKEEANGGPERGSFYTWQDTQYSQFMIKLLQNLEPRFYQVQEYIFEEDEEVNEQIYVITKNLQKSKEQNGKYCIGFSHSNQKYFHVKLGYKTIIGGYENLFGYKSEFFYRALHHIDAYGLRKDKLKPIMDEYPDFQTQISSYMVNFYYRIIQKPMLEFKRSILIQVCKRQDIDKVIKEIDTKIADSQAKFEEEFNKSYEQESGNQDVTHRNVQKLERKVNHLAKSVHDLFVQFDELGGDKKEEH